MAKVKYVDPQPKGGSQRKVKAAVRQGHQGKSTLRQQVIPERYNLGFYAPFGSDPPLYLEVSKRFLNFYHNVFPDVMKGESPWKVKLPSSRATCKCHVISQVDSFCDVIGKMRSFVTQKKLKNKEGKFGTIFIVAHGFHNYVGLPVDTNAPSISVSHLAICLKKIKDGNIGRQSPPMGLPPEFWAQLKPPLIKLETLLKGFSKLSASWFDNQTLIRFWVCFLGMAPGPGDEDPLKVFGQLIAPGRKLMLEAPKVWSIPTEHFYYRRPTGTKVFQHMIKEKYLPPDVISEIESDKNQTKFSGNKLAIARDEFGVKILKQGRLLSQRNRSGYWAPAFGVMEQKGNKRIWVWPGDWRKFRSYWRRVTL